MGQGSCVAALEKEAVSFPMGGPVDFTNGKRHGLDQLSLQSNN